jgi:hypothetical protein
MSYAALSCVFINANEADPNGRGTLAEPQWGVAEAGWYMTCAFGLEVFGPFETLGKARAELEQFVRDRERGIT